MLTPDAYLAGHEKVFHIPWTEFPGRIRIAKLR
jgi:hypothetical protein